MRGIEISLYSHIITPCKQTHGVISTTPIYTTIIIMRGTEISLYSHIINLCAWSWVRETLLELRSKLRPDALHVTAIDFSVIRTDY